MPTELLRPGAALLAVWLAGCAAVPAPPQAPIAPPSPPEVATAEPEPPPRAPAPVPLLSALFAPAPAPADTVLGYADRLRTLAAPELAQEIQRLGDMPFKPLHAVQLALAIAQARNPAQLPRAQALLQRVLAQRDAEAEPLHPLARLLAAQFAEQRRLDELAERHAQQLREAQRRIDQLNDRLEAVRAIERSLPSRQRATPPPAPRRPTQD